MMNATCFWHACMSLLCFALMSGHCIDVQRWDDDGMMMVLSFSGRFEKGKRHIAVAAKLCSLHNTSIELSNVLVSHVPQAADSQSHTYSLCAVTLPLLCLWFNRHIGVHQTLQKTSFNGLDRCRTKNDIKQS
eukprot:m.35688 g.35688  ORF g.35688 m.35688 type:complete len:132 (-) comp9913_c0_seq4:2598-2993(-)